jgi:DNA-binding IclR family transcriptional regulator
MSQNRRAVFDCLDLADRPMTPKEVAEETGLKHASVKHILLRMLRDGALKADASGRYDLAKR